MTVKLPNAENAIVPSDKLAGYLLSRSHLIGRWKARFFLSIGFTETRIDESKDALIDVAKQGEVKSTITSEFGVKYVVEGLILGPSGRRSAIRTVWIVEKGQDRPRLATAYPL